MSKKKKFKCKTFDIGIYDQFNLPNIVYKKDSCIQNTLFYILKYLFKLNLVEKKY